MDTTTLKWIFHGFRYERLNIVFSGEEMCEMNEVHKKQVEILRSGTYESLLVRRNGNRCYFVIGFDGELHAYLNQFGKCPNYHHAWQIRKWLKETFGIEPEKVEVWIAGK
jgi:hypothetical protein